MIGKHEARITSGTAIYTISYLPLSTIEKCPTSHVESACVISYLYAMKFVMPPITFQTLIHKRNEYHIFELNVLDKPYKNPCSEYRCHKCKSPALPHSEEFGRNTSASSIPSWADEIVAPVDGETNLFMQSCCIISPAVLRPIPVHKLQAVSALSRSETISQSPDFLSKALRDLCRSRR